MALKTEQYLALSKLAYADFNWPADKDESISDLLSTYNVAGEGEPVLQPLDDLGSWQLVGYDSVSGSGFTGMAFRNPSTGEIAFAFRGTEPGFNGDIYDIGTDINIVLGQLPTQFINAYDLYDSVHDIYPSATYSFTGHSLGGAIAQYMTFMTDDYSETFNAVGAVDAIKSVEPSIESNLAHFQSLSVDHVNSFDIIGLYGRNLGHTVQHLDASDVDYTKVDFSIVQQAIGIHLQQVGGIIPESSAVSQIIALLDKIPSQEAREDTVAVINGYRGLGGQGGGFIFNPIESHNPESMVYTDGNGDTSITATIDSQVGFTQGKYLFSLVNAIEVIKTAQYEGVYTNTVTRQPFAGGVVVDEGYNFIVPVLSIPGVRTYTDNQIEYANFVIQTYQRGLQTGRFSDVYADLQLAIGAETRRLDPLVLDLDGDGIETTPLDGSNVHFDLDNNSLAETTSWVSPDDGLLVLDKNADGIINDSTELFGDHTLLSDNVTYASSGFAALAEYDSDYDGQITEYDSIFSSLRVWQDMDSDGITDSGELKTLLELGIVSIGLGYLNTGLVDGANNIQVRAGEFIKSDNSSGTVGEYLFQRDVRDSIEESLSGIPSAIALLPNVQGTGDVVSLRKAMVEDTTGDLQGLVEDFMVEDNVTVRHNLFEQILYKWSGVDAINPASRGGLYDAQKLAIIESFVGIEYSGNPSSPEAITSLELAYGKLYDVLYADLLGKTHLTGLMSQIEEASDGSLSFSGVQSQIDSVLVQDVAEGVALLSEFSRVIRFYGLQMNSDFLDLRHYYANQSDDYARAIDFAVSSVFYGTSSSDVIVTDTRYLAFDAGAGDDTITASTTSDVTMYGGDGSDVISGATGNDLLFGNADDDYISGAAGNDLLYGNEGTDVLSGGAGNDTLTGGIGDDILYGGASDDSSNTHYSGNGNDTYIFNIGDGIDTIYDYDNTEGNIDTILFGPGIAPEDIIFTRPVSDDYSTSNQLEISIVGNIYDRLIVKDFFLQYYGFEEVNNNGIEKIKFADSAVELSVSDIVEQARHRTGTADVDVIESIVGVDNIIHGLDGDDYISGSNGNDSLYGGSGDDVISGDSGDDTILGGSGNDVLDGGANNDTITGGSGDDTLQGGSGDDVYVFAAGDGVDNITENGGVDSALLDYSAVDTIFEEVNGAIYITFAGSADSITVNSWYWNDDFRLDTIESNNGYSIANDQVEQLIQAMATYSSQNNGISWQDALQQNPQDVQNVLSQFWVSTS